MPAAERYMPLTEKMNKLAVAVFAMTMGVSWVCWRMRTPAGTRLD
jgi:hypothetical protein